MSRRRRLLALAALVCAGLGAWQLAQPVRWVATVAGAARGFADGAGGAARFDRPGDVVLDGRRLYVADTYNHRVRAIDLDAPGGPAVTTLAGTGGRGGADGPGARATFRFPRALALDAATRTLYVADTTNDRVRAIALDAPGHPVTTVAGSRRGRVDGPGATARFFAPWGLAADGAGGLWVADTYNNAVRRIDLGAPGRPVTTVAGGAAGYRDGPAAGARFFGPAALAFDRAHGWLYVADASNRCIRRVATRAPGLPVSTFAGYRVAEAAAEAWAVDVPLLYPAAVAVDGEGRLLTCDQATNAIVRITPDGALTTLAGRAGLPPGFFPGPSLVAKFSGPAGLAVGPDGAIYVADVYNDRVRRLR